MNLHNEIMNMKYSVPKDANINQSLSFKQGHKQARHDAAELANAADAEIERLRNAIEQAAEQIRRYDYTPARSTLLMALKMPNVELTGVPPTDATKGG